MIGLGLGACSDAALKDQKSVTSGSVSQNNETKTTGGVKTNESNLSSFFDITYFDFDSAELSAETRKVLETSYFGALVLFAQVLRAQINF